MATTQDDIRGWFKRGIKDKATHLIVVCDTYDHEDYPVFVPKGADAKIMAENYNAKEMQRVMEVYNLGLPIEDQIHRHRCFEY